MVLPLAGHSHCGAVNLPFFGRLAAASDGSRRWPCGLHEERGGKLYVSGAPGVSTLAVRLGQPPEITVLTLRGTSPGYLPPLPGGLDHSGRAP